MPRTPSPWRVEPGGFVGGPVGFGRVCQTWNKHEEDFQNAEANAHLIAAAPDLLDALKRLLASDGTGNAATHGDGCRCVTHEAKAAIAKAEGAAQ